MSAAQTVPIFDPSGVLRDVPYEQMRDAVSNGGKPAVRFQAPDQSIRYVPADQTKDAVQAGGKILPFEQQDIQHPGFWMSLGSDLGGMVKGLIPDNPFTETHAGLVNKLHQEQASDAAAENSPERNAHGSFYKNVTVPAATAIGVNVPGMEQSAAQGDEAGVYGHAAAPAVAAAVAEGVKAALPTLIKAGKATAGVIRDVATPENIATAAGGVTGAALGHTVGEPFALSHTGANLGRQIGKAIAKRLAGGEGEEVLDATGENKPFAGGTDEPAPQKILDATGENKPFAGGMDEPLPPKKPAQSTKSAAPRTVVVDPKTGAPEFSDVVAANSPESTALHMSAFDQAKANLGPQASASDVLKEAARIQQAGPKAVRTVVTDPQTGRPEFSDVVEAKQAQPQPQAQTTAPETKPAPQETQAPIPETKNLRVITLSP